MCRWICGLAQAELMRSLNLVQPAGFAFVKTPGVAGRGGSFAPRCRTQFPLKLAVQFAAPEECAAGAVSVAALLGEAMRACCRLAVTRSSQTLRKSYAEAAARVSPEDGALVIFTTGSTGSPKPALLSHRNISCQAMCLSQALLSGSERELVTLVNLPPSHVGCQTELLMGTIFDGGLRRAGFHLRSAALGARHCRLRGHGAGADSGDVRVRVAIEGVSIRSTSPAWILRPTAGSRFRRRSLQKMAQMAPNVGTGLGLTEAAGFCTYLRVPSERCGGVRGKPGIRYAGVSDDDPRSHAGRRRGRGRAAGWGRWGTSASAGRRRFWDTSTTRRRRRRRFPATAIFTRETWVSR